MSTVPDALLDAERRAWDALEAVRLGYVWGLANDLRTARLMLPALEDAEESWRAAMNDLRKGS